MPPSSSRYGNRSFHICHDPVEGRRLLAAAGYGPDHKPDLRFMMLTSSAEQMYPAPMNEPVQQNLAEVGRCAGVAGAARPAGCGGAMGPSSEGVDAISNAWNSMDPISAFLRHVDARGLVEAQSWHVEFSPVSVQ